MWGFCVFCASVGVAEAGAVEPPLTRPQGGPSLATMSKTPNAQAKLNHARYRLHRLEEEFRKGPVRDPLAIKYEAADCIEAAANAFNRLSREVNSQAFKKAHHDWRTLKLTQNEQEFFNSMTAARDSDVHQKDIEVTAVEREVPAITVDGVTTVSGPVEAVSKCTVMLHDYHLGDDELTEACRKFIAYTQDLIDQFQ